MTTVLDASAVLAFLLGEAGAVLVEEALETGATCGAANWSEVAQKVRSAGRDWDLSSALLQSYEMQVADVTEIDAESAARLWRRGEGLSLADRLCLALADRLNAPVLTADTSWGSAGRIQQIR
jgi:PIN domain nuclease of toxin-antitoxin system